MEGGKTHFGDHPVYTYEKILDSLEPELRQHVQNINETAQQLGFRIKINADKPLHPMELMHEFFAVEKEIKKHESKPQVKEKLEALTRKYVQNTFNLSEKEFNELFSKVNLTNEPIQYEEEPQNTPKEKPDYSKKVLELIQARHSHDLLINGLGISAMLDVSNTLEKELNEIHPRLSKLYNLYSNLAQYSNFLAARDNAKPPAGIPIIKAGEFKLKWLKGEVKAEAQGITFPILVQEAVKAVAETCMAHGLPKTLTPEELVAWQKELHHSTHSHNEHWQFILGKPVAEKTRSLLTKLGFTRGYSTISVEELLNNKKHEESPRDTLAYSLMLLSKMPSQRIEAIIKKAVNPTHPVNAKELLEKTEGEL